MMNSFVAHIAICCLVVTAKARPGYDHGSNERLEATPNLQSFGDIKYPSFMLLQLGEYSKGHLPADQIHEVKHITIKEPQPYPVKIPVPHPYPVPVSKPYPIVETKYVKVPHAVPYEIVKNVPVPVEVPKPYPVPVHNYGSSSSGGDLHHAGSQAQAYGIPEHNNELESSGGGNQHLNSYEAQGQLGQANYAGDLGGQGSYGGDTGGQGYYGGEQASQGPWQGIEPGH